MAKGRPKSSGKEEVRPGEKVKKKHELEPVGEQRGWASSAKYKYKSGRLEHPNHGTIKFGNKYMQCFGPSRVDLRDWPHGDERDSNDVAVRGFKIAADLIHQQLKEHKQVSINCANGQSRTSFALMAFLIRYHEFSYQEAEDFIKEATQYRMGNLNFKPMFHDERTGISYGKALKAASENLPTIDADTVQSEIAACVKTEVKPNEHGTRLILKLPSEKTVCQSTQAMELPPSSFRTNLPSPRQSMEIESPASPSEKRRRSSMELTLAEYQKRKKEWFGEDA